MANVKFIVGTKEQYLNIAEKNTYALYFCTDTCEMFKGDALFNDAVRYITSYADLPQFTLAADGILYFTQDTKNGYVLNDKRDGWIQVIYAPVTDISSVPEGQEGNVTATVGALLDVKEELQTYIDEQIKEVEVASSLDGGEI